MSWEAKFVESACCVVRLPKLVGKERPRFRGHVFTPQRTKDAEKAIRDAWLAQVGTKWVDWDDEVRVHIEVQRPVSKSTPKKDVGRVDRKKPDNDNVEKLVWDALSSHTKRVNGKTEHVSGVAFKDDAQITRNSCQKMRLCAYRDYVEITVHVYYYKEKWVNDD